MVSRRLPWDNDEIVGERNPAPWDHDEVVSSPWDHDEVVSATPETGMPQHPPAPQTLWPPTPTAQPTLTPASNPSLIYSGLTPGFSPSLKPVDRIVGNSPALAEAATREDMRIRNVGGRDLLPTHLYEQAGPVAPRYQPLPGELTPERAAHIEKIQSMGSPAVAEFETVKALNADGRQAPLFEYQPPAPPAEPPAAIEGQSPALAEAMIQQQEEKAREAGAPLREAGEEYKENLVNPYVVAAGKRLASGATMGAYMPEIDPQFAETAKVLGVDPLFLMGNLIGAYVTGGLGPAGISLLMGGTAMGYLQDLKSRGVNLDDPREMQKVMPAAVFSGFTAGVIPGTAGKGLLQRLPTGIGLGVAQNVTDEATAAGLSGTKANYGPAAIVGGIFGAGAGLSRGGDGPGTEPRAWETLYHRPLEQEMERQGQAPQQPREARHFRPQEAEFRPVSDVEAAAAQQSPTDIFPEGVKLPEEKTVAAYEDGQVGTAAPPLEGLEDAQRPPAEPGTAPEAPAERQAVDEEWAAATFANLRKTGLTEEQANVAMRALRARIEAGAPAPEVRLEHSGEAPRSFEGMAGYMTRHRRATEYLTAVNKAAPTPGDVARFLRDLGDKPMPAMPGSGITREFKGRRNSQELEFTEGLLRGGDPEYPTLQMPAKEAPPKFTLMGREYKRVKSKTRPGVFYKDDLGTQFYFGEGKDPIHMDDPARPFSAEAAGRPPAAPESRGDEDAGLAGLWQEAAVAGLPERAHNNPAIVERARQVWREKGTESPWFRRWFEGSQVADGAAPRVVYHGTPRSGFSEFDTQGKHGLFGQGSYFTESPEIASSYSKKNGIPEEPRGAGVMPVYLNIKNAIDMDALASPKWREVFEEAGFDADWESIKSNEDAYRAMEENLSDEGYSRAEGDAAAREYLEGMGFDGITHMGGGRHRQSDGTAHRVWVAFQPEQIKSATGNRGTFDEGSPDILFQPPNRKSLGEVQRGDKLNSVKALLRKQKSEEALPELPEYPDTKGLASRVERFLREGGTIEAAGGRKVALANPEADANGPTLLKRAVHMITRDSGSGGRNPDPTRIPWVGAIPRTIADADLVASGRHKGRERVYYLRKYQKGTHLVITDPKGNLVDQGSAEGLISQFPPDMARAFDESFRVEYSKQRAPGRESGGPLSGSLRPGTTGTSGQPGGLSDAAAGAGPDRKVTGPNIPPEGPERNTLPQQARDSRGVFEWQMLPGKVKRPVITLFRGKADFSTVMHEIGHWMRQTALTEADEATAAAWVESQGIRVRDDSGRWTREAEEKFADGLERYLYDGEAPSEGLRAIFEKIKAWMRSVYRSLPPRMRANLPKDMRELYGRLLGMDGEGAAGGLGQVEASTRALEQPARDGRQMPERYKRAERTGLVDEKYERPPVDLPPPREVEAFPNYSEAQAPANLPKERPRPPRAEDELGPEHISRDATPVGPETGYQTAAERMYTAFVNQAEPIEKIQRLAEKAMGRKLKPWESLREAIYRVLGSGGIANVYIRKFLMPIVKYLSVAERRLLDEYAVACDHAWRHKNTPGFDSHITPLLAERVKEKIYKLPDAQKQRIMTAHGKLLAYAHDLAVRKVVSGLWTREEFDAVTQNPFYIPEIRDWGKVKDRQSGRNAKKDFAATDKLLRGTVASELDPPVLDPLSALVQDTHDFAAEASKARLMERMVDLAAQVPELQYWFRLLPKGHEVTKDQRVVEVLKTRTVKLTEEDLKLAKEVQDARHAQKLAEANDLYGTHQESLKNKLWRDAQKAKNPQERQAKEVELESLFKKMDEIKLRRDVWRQKKKDKATATLEAFEALRKNPETAKRHGKIEQWLDEGEVTRYLVPTELGDAINGLGPQEMPFFIKAMASIATFFRRNMTGRLSDFPFANVARDIQDAYINTGMRPELALKGIWHFVKKDEVWESYMRQGGSMEGTEASSKKATDYARKIRWPGVYDKFKDKKEFEGRTRRLPVIGRDVSTGRLERMAEAIAATGRAVGESLDYFGEALEMGTRLGIFEHRLNKGEAPSTAASWGRQGTLDFRRVGKDLKTPNALIVFLNASIQGLDRAFRTIIGKTWEERAISAARIGASALLPTLALYAWNRDEEGYSDIPSWEKETNWIIMLPGKRQYMKIPKGHFAQMITSPIQMWIENKDGRSISGGWDIARYIMGSALPVESTTGIMPHALKFPFEQAINTDIYFNRQIADPRAVKENQYNSGTYQTIVQAGQAMHISPARLQHIAKSLFGGTAVTALFALDQVLGLSELQPLKKTDPGWMPIVKRFYGQSKAWKSDFEKARRDAEKRLKELKSGRGGVVIRNYMAAKRDGRGEQFKNQLNEDMQRQIDAIEEAQKQLHEILKKAAANRSLVKYLASAAGEEPEED